MTLSQIRAELLQQHAELRRMVERARLCSEPACDDASMAQNRLSEMRLLADAVQRHNRREEHLLRSLILTVDAWGRARAEVMTDEHVREHEALHRGLLATPCTPSEFANAGMDRVLDALLSHLAHEEQAFLNDRVLCDDIVVADPFSG
ncbi:MAG: hemerythrin domain-containing protein [Polyangiaceae bacterium]|jgi:hypothetical protein